MPRLRTHEPSSTPRDDGTPRLGRLVHADDTRTALRMAGLHDLLHPSRVAAMIYPDLAYFSDSAARDRAEHGNEVYGPYVTDDGLLGIIDMRSQMRTLRSGSDVPGPAPGPAPGSAGDQPAAAVRFPDA